MRGRQEQWTMTHSSKRKIPSLQDNAPGHSNLRLHQERNPRGRQRAPQKGGKPTVNSSASNEEARSSIKLDIQAPMNRQRSPAIYMRTVRARHTCLSYG
ncbi:hypothetical protein CDAR_378871 [Caerostris darwini]|uniref:Uncharacterized protein n=1 Tax=Caerostris darwini TaxID=1538125 RepID=A0AAV4TYR0_9ARAC|nr:hypothetical protein CDAR_378871 [Caerostris darwini]